MNDFIAQIVETESQLYAEAEQRLPDWLPITKECLDHLDSAITSIGTTQHHAAALWFAAQRYYAKSALSIIRCHQSQSAFNLRQGIENTVLTAFMLGNPDLDPTTDPNATGDGDNFLDPQKLQDKARKWVAKQFVLESDQLKDLKTFVNNAFLHGSVYLTHLSFEWEASDSFRGFLFDRLPKGAAELFLLQLCQAMIMSARLIRRAAALQDGFQMVPDAEPKEQALLKRCKDLWERMEPIAVSL